MPRLLIDFRDPFSGTAGRRLYRDPAAVLVAHRVDQVVAVLTAVDDATRRHGQHAAGFLSYEAAPAFDRAFAVRTGARLPLAWFALFDGYETGAPVDRSDPMAAMSWQLDTTRAQYDSASTAIRAAIEEGGTYQVNFTTRLRTQFDGAAEPWYDALRQAQGPGLHAFFDLEDSAILSISPELFFARRGRVLTTRPMKGTRARGRWLEEDALRAHELVSSPKERAENLMIVDLLRNDLGRLAETGSVQVPRMFELERYRTVWQLTSTVQATVPERTTLPDIFGALFPCGSVTGAPKISTMQLIAGLETSPREVYCGALGVVEPGGDCTFNVPIRTVWIERGNSTAVYGVGSGVTWDSHADAEFEELQAKAAILNEACPRFQLLETMRLQDGTVTRLERHLDRLRASAEYFSFRCDLAALRAQLAGHLRTTPPGAWRLRLLLDEQGTARLETHALEPAHDTAPRVVLARDPVQSGNRFLYHKTTSRALYDEARANAPAAFDVLLWNERGELTEFTRGNLVLELAGALCTPPRSAGLLAGTFRAELLEQGTIAERSILVDDLRQATATWFINSVREWTRVRLP